MAYEIDQTLCSCCHRCRVECPVGAIRFKGSKYWIDPDKCTNCGHCATVCHNEVITNPQKPAPTPVPHETACKSCDVVVVGGGAAGMAAGARAASLGKRVIVLEKGQEVGGSAWYAHMFRSQWSRWHEAAGVPDPREKLVAQFMKKTEGRVDEALIRRLLDADVDFVNWLIEDEDLGRDFHLGDGPFGALGLVADYVEPYNKKRIDTTIGPGGNGWFLCRKLLKIIEDHGGQVLYHTAGEKLLTREGRVTGVLARDPGGQVQIDAKATVIAAGAFSRNKALMDKFQPLFYQDAGNEPVHVFTCSRCTGDGITMCDGIGADIDYETRRVNLFGPARHPFGTCGLAASRGMSCMHIDRDGNPYNHPMEMTEVSPLAHVPGRYLWSVLDARALQDAMEQAKGRTPDVVGIDMDRLYDNYQAEIDQEVAWGSIKKADTLAGLAKELGIPAEKLLADVEAHNAHLHDPMPPMGPPPGGDDEDDNPMFGGMKMPDPTPIETGPFYAIFVKLFHENAVGGVVTDENMDVKRGGQPVPGLYAAGDNARGIMLPGSVGVQYIEGVLSALTVAFCSGYVAGIEASKFASQA